MVSRVQTHERVAWSEHIIKSKCEVFKGIGAAVTAYMSKKTFAMKPRMEWSQKICFTLDMPSTKLVGNLFTFVQRGRAVTLVE